MKEQFSLFAGVSLLACGIANAQTPPATESAVEAPAPTPAAAAEAPGGDIVVTGSRVIRNGNNSPTPVTVMTVQELQTTKPNTVFEALLDLPAFAGSRGGVSSSPTGNGANSGQISALNLRGLGPVRTLILFDGRRVPPTQQDGFVNANVVPNMLLQRVDVVTGGASAVYGSDAIGGVVNFITDRSFNGIKLEVQGGTSERNDAATYQIGAAVGTPLFGGRGHFEASIQKFYDQGILDRNDRAQFHDRWTVQGNGCPNGIGSVGCVPYYRIAGATANSWSFGGKIVGTSPATGPANPLANFTFNPDGTLRPFDTGTPVLGSSSVQIGGDGIWDTGSTLKPQQDILQGFARFDFDVTDDIHFFASGAYTRDHTYNFFGDANSNAIILSAYNAFLRPEYRATMLARGVTNFTFSKKYGLNDIVPKTNIDNTTRSIIANAGLEGTLGAFKWDMSYQHSDIKLTTYGNFTFNNGPFFAAIDAVDQGLFSTITAAGVPTGTANGNIVCRVTITNPGLYPGCVPINLFGAGSELASALDYVRRQGTFVTRLPLDDFNASISGSPLDLWAGPLTVALSGEWRRQGLQTTSTNPTVDYAPLDCTGLRPVGGPANCTVKTATNIGSPSFNGGVAPRPKVHMDVAEAALEADVPLLKDVTLFQSLSRR